MDTAERAQNHRVLGALSFIAPFPATLNANSTDQNTDGTNELYAVSGSGGTPIKLNGPMVPSGGINGKGVAISRDGSRAVYLADQLVDSAFELFSAPSTGGEATRLNAPMVVGGDVLQSSVFISANSSRVVYRADADTDEVVELYSVPIAGGAPTKLNGQLTLGGDVLEGSLQFSPDSSHVLYLADQEANDVVELYEVSSLGGDPLKLNGPMIVGGDVTSALFTPNGSRVVYRADQDSDEVFELYSVPSLGTG